MPGGPNLSTAKLAGREPAVLVTVLVTAELAGREAACEVAITVVTVTLGRRDTAVAAPEAPELLRIYFK